MPEDLFRAVEALFLKQVTAQAATTTTKKGGGGGGGGGGSPSAAPHPVAISQFLLGCARAGQRPRRETVEALLAGLVAAGAAGEARQLATAVRALGDLARRERPEEAEGLRGVDLAGVKGLFLMQLRAGGGKARDVDDFVAGYVALQDNSGSGPAREDEAFFMELDQLCH